MFEPLETCVCQIALYRFCMYFFVWMQRSPEGKGKYPWRLPRLWQHPQSWAASKLHLGMKLEDAMAIQNLLNVLNVRIPGFDALVPRYDAPWLLYCLTTWWCWHCHLFFPPSLRPVRSFLCRCFQVVNGQMCSVAVYLAFDRRHRCGYPQSGVETAKSIALSNCCNASLWSTKFHADALREIHKMRLIEDDAYCHNCGSGAKVCLEMFTLLKTLQGITCVSVELDSKPGMKSHMAWNNASSSQSPVPSKCSCPRSFSCKDAKWKIQLVLMPRCFDLYKTSNCIFLFTCIRPSMYSSTVGSIGSGPCTAFSSWRPNEADILAGTETQNPQPNHRNNSRSRKIHSIWNTVHLIFTVHQFRPTDV